MKVDFSALNNPRFMTIPTNYDSQPTCQQCGEDLENNCIYDCGECVVLCHPCGNGEVPLDALLKEINRLTAENERLSEALELAAAELEAQTKEIDRLNKVVDQAIECYDLIKAEDYIASCTDNRELAAELERRSDK